MAEVFDKLAGWQVGFSEEADAVVLVIENVEGAQCSIAMPRKTAGELGRALAELAPKILT